MIVVKDIFWFQIGKNLQGLSNFPPIKNGISYLSPARKLKYFLGVPEWEDLKKGDISVSIHITYEDENEKHYDHIVDYDFGQMQGVLFDSFEDSNLAIAEAIREAERNRQSHESSQEMIRAFTTGGQKTKQCPMCAESIRDKAKKCPHCHELI